MVVQHNMQAMNANRMLNITTGSQAKSTEKLSSGFKINRAADDAAGLSISEKMRKQIRGLDRASTNAQDGVSAVQTAEGALTEVHSMLQRMNELAVQASNGTNSESDRKSIQDEIDQLTTEIDRVSETTKFNETYLLKGDGTKFDMKIAAHDAGLAGKLTDAGNTATFALDKALEKGDKITIAGNEYTIGDKAAATTEGYAKLGDFAAGQTLGDTILKAGDSITKNGTTYTMVDKVANAAWQTGAQFTVEDDMGNVKTYTIAAATDLSLAAPTLKDTDAVKFIADQLATNHKVTMTLTKTGGTQVSCEVVDALESGEISTVPAATGGRADNKLSSIATNADGAGTTALAAGDSVTINGKTTIATATTPVSAAAIADIVTAMKDGDQIQIGATAITVGDKTDLTTSTATTEDILGMLTDGAQVEFAIATNNKAAIDLLAANGINNSTTLGTNTNVVSVVGTPGGADSADGNVLTVGEAYDKIAEELAKASSIGTDEGKEAKVTNKGDGTFSIEKGSVNVKNGLSFSLHVGADADMTNKIQVDIDTMSSAGLGIKGIKVDGDDVTNATYAIDAIADAVAKVSAQRSALGAVQNRLEHTIANVDNVVENTTAAESRIRDTDMAKEMVEYSKNNILAQAGQSMLAQANQANQGVLSLLG